MKKMSDNRDLYEYLLFLSSELKQRGLTSLSETVEFASSQASACVVTEFIGESRIALREVLNKENGTLTQQERADLIDVLKQLDQALDER